MSALTFPQRTALSLLARAPTSMALHDRGGGFWTLAPGDQFGARTRTLRRLGQVGLVSFVAVGTKGPRTGMRCAGLTDAGRARVSALARTGDLP